MDPLLVLLLVLLGFMIIGSLIAIETRDLLSSIISVGAVGLALNIVFLMLGAPDLAITQAVVEIIILVVLLRVILTRRDESYATSRSTLAVGSVLLVLGFLVALVFCALSRSGGDGLQMCPFGNPLMNESGPATAMAPAGEPQAVPPEHRMEAMPQSIGGAYLKYGLEKTRAANYVTGILLDYRAYDTLGEATVIFVAIIGAYAVLRKVGRHRHGRDVVNR